MGIKFMAFGRELFIHDTVINSWIIVIALSIFALVVNSKVKKAKVDEKPKGLLNVVEIFVGLVQSLVKSTMGTGPTRDRLMPYIGTLLLYIACANLSGLLGVSPPTSDYNVTLALAIITFTLTQYYGIKTNGIGGYIKGYFDPNPVMLPLNIVGELSNPISLSFRLFGNILSGGIIMSLVYEALRYISPLITPALHAYFDIFSGLVQTFIFAMLTMVFVGGNLPDEEGI
ncbi:ATP synthase subunit a [Gottschalkia purinilytica]|uniref:ATP synthase subunit a n=1 Tax=Gottschalkia purinilytica TaxID=1503 RepID=A0A0L0WE71_GOTPU|nr:F0F1 ATP synthase subunit A [Gottschalkia purinilytica]KNF09720.1 ATP synthase subunit a [Gottschalkia purinilytica]